MCSLSCDTFPNASGTTPGQAGAVEFDAIVPNTFNPNGPVYSVYKLVNPLTWWTANACPPATPCLPISFTSTNTWFACKWIPGYTVNRSCTANGERINSLSPPPLSPSPPVIESPPPPSPPPPPRGGGRLPLLLPAPSLRLHFPPVLRARSK